LGDLANKAVVSSTEVAEATNTVEKAENEILAKRVALKTAEAKVAEAKAQVKVVVAKSNWEPHRLIDDLLVLLLLPSFEYFIVCHLSGIVANGHAHCV
jgi:uncharacterized protein YajQ (UPF0234 family)